MLFYFLLTGCLPFFFSRGRIMQIPNHVIGDSIEERFCQHVACSLSRLHTPAKCYKKQLTQNQKQSNQVVNNLIKPTTEWRMRAKEIQKL